MAARRSSRVLLNRSCEFSDESEPILEFVFAGVWREGLQVESHQFGEGAEGGVCVVVLQNCVDDHYEFSGVFYEVVQGVWHRVGFLGWSVKSVKSVISLLRTRFLSNGLKSK